MKKYYDRQHAGHVLAEALTSYANDSSVIVLALPRGGVPIGYEVAKVLHAPLDVFIVRKLGVPDHEELAMGAIAMGGMTFLNEHMIKQLQIASSAIQQVIQNEKKELVRRQRAYRDDLPFPDIKNKHVILVDDGIATGATIHVAIQSLRTLEPTKITVAVPVAESSVAQQIAAQVDDFVCPLKPAQLYAVGAWYEAFDQTSDDEVRRLLTLARSFV